MYDFAKPYNCRPTSRSKTFAKQKLSDMTPPSAPHSAPSTPFNVPAGTQDAEMSI